MKRLGHLSNSKFLIMKQFTLFSIMLFTSFSYNSHAQYQSIFGVESTEWNFIALTCDAALVETYTQERDTMIDNLQYQIIDDFGLFRESEDRSKVWFRDFDSSEELLLMDLELSINDVFAINGVEYLVDSIYVEDNRKTIEFDLIPFHCGTYERLQFTEGHGPNMNFRFMATGNDLFMDLLRCQTKDGVTENFLSELGFGEGCANDIVRTKDYEINGLVIHPNPTWGELTIDLPEFLSGRLTVRSLTGQVVYIQDVDYTEQIKLDFYRQDAGMYVVEVVSESGERYVEKVVVF